MRYASLLVAAALAGALFTAAARAQDAIDPRRVTTPAPLLIGSQSDCDNDLQTTNSTTFANVPGTVVTIDNGDVARNVVVTFSAEGNVVDEDNVLVVHFRIDGLIQPASGPEFLASNTTPTDAHTIVSVFLLGPGVHTIRPVFRSLLVGQTANLSFRCLTVEGRTR